MLLWLEIKYANMLSGSLDRYQVKKQHPFNATFRCPVCGDSQSNKLKTRGHILEYKGTLFFKCHNCSASNKFDKFLKRVNEPLYNEFRLENLKENGGGLDDSKYKVNLEKFGKTRAEKFDPLKELKRVSQLKHDHPVKKYIEDRKIPPSAHYKLYYAPKFIAWVNKYIPGKFSEKAKEEPRLVIPLIDERGYVFAATARSFDPKAKSKYITVKFQEETKKYFGLNEFSRDKQGYVVEGPIDALFLPNCLAMCGSDADLDSLDLNGNTTIVYDNEPRNREIVRKIESAVLKGRRICLWPETPGKDINDMVLNGWTPENVKKVIDENSYSGALAQLQFVKWRKI